MSPSHRAHELHTSAPFDVIVSERSETTRRLKVRSAEAGVSTDKKSFGTLLLAIWALPGIGIPTLLLLLQRRKRGRAADATSNDRGRYG